MAGAGACCHTQCTVPSGVARNAVVPAVGREMSAPEERRPAARSPEQAPVAAPSAPCRPASHATQSSRQSAVRCLRRRSGAPQRGHRSRRLLPHPVHRAVRRRTHDSARMQQDRRRSGLQLGCTATLASATLPVAWGEREEGAARGRHGT